MPKSRTRKPSPGGVPTTTAAGRGSFPPAAERRPPPSGRDASPRRERDRRSIWLLAATSVIWIAIVVTLVLHHEPWRDEADTWLAARDLSPAGLWRFAGYVGSPLLWYWLQMPLAKLGAPYHPSLGLLNATFAAIAVGLFLWRAPFPWWIRVGFAFSYFGAYEYAVIARSYALGMALLFALAAHDRARHARPLFHGALIALLVNTSVHALLVGATLLATFAWDAWRTWRGTRDTRPVGGAALGAAGLALAVIQLLPRPDGQLAGFADRPEWGTVATTLAGALFPTAQVAPLAILAAWVVWVAAAAALLRSPRALFVMLGSSASLWLLFVVKYTGELRHWGFLLLAMLHALWIERAPSRDAGGVASGADARDVESRGRNEPSGSEARRAPALRTVADAGLAVALAWSVFVAFEHGRRDLGSPFSASRAVASYLETPALTRVPIAAWPAPHAEAVLPYLPGVRFFYPGTNAWGTHMTWTRDCVAGWTIPEDEVVKRVTRAFPSGDLVLLANQPMRAAEAAGFRLVHAAVGDVMMGDEQYFVYRR